MNYSVKQTQTKKNLFGFEKQVKKTYTFKHYVHAVKFALNEQIDIITCNLGDGVTTTRKPFKNILKLSEFERLAKINPAHYLGTHYSERLNLKNYYFYLINTEQFHRLKKFNH